jgi:uncharacterized coiled-coil protein SlyX
MPMGQCVTQIAALLSSLTDMTTEQFLSYGFDAAMAVIVFLGKLSLDDRDRRLAKVETLMSEGVKSSEDKLTNINQRISMTEIRAERAETRLQGIVETLTRIERTMERLAEKLDEVTRS